MRCTGRAADRECRARDLLTCFGLAESAGAYRAVIEAAYPDLECQTVGQDVICIESAERVAVGPLVRVLEDAGGEVTEARKVRPSLEAVFARITGVAGTAMQRETERIPGGGA